jgi:hypothetical protein
VSIRWVTAFLDLPSPPYDAAVRFWADATGTRLSSPRGESGEFATLLPDEGDAYLRVQRVGSDTPGIHLDLHVEDVIAFAWGAVSLGAKEIVRHEDALVVLESPGGFRFCVVPWLGQELRPTPYAGIVDQVCLDINPSVFEVEAAFWADLSQWELRRGSRDEFVVLARPAGQPIRLLLQRLDDEGPGPVRAHLDLAAGTEVDKVAVRLQEYGARARRETAGWMTLRDPAGLEFCVTSRDPETGVLG